MNYVKANPQEFIQIIIMKNLLFNMHQTQLILFPHISHFALSRHIINGPNHVRSKIYETEIELKPIICVDI